VKENLLSPHPSGIWWWWLKVSIHVAICLLPNVPIGQSESNFTTHINHLYMIPSTVDSILKSHECEHTCILSFYFILFLNVYYTLFYNIPLSLLIPFLPLSPVHPNFAALCNCLVCLLVELAVLVGSYHRIGGAYHLHLQEPPHLNVVPTIPCSLVNDFQHSTKQFVSTCKTAWNHTPENHNPHSEM
jgi:hypothetical protein